MSERVERGKQIFKSTDRRQKQLSKATLDLVNL